MTEAYLSLGQQNAGQGSYLVQTGTPASSILVTAVSQNAGTINGGSVVTVYGQNFFVGMTSTLGAVTNVAGGTATITTSSHAAGAVSWTLTNTDGSTSSSQTFTYLAHPGTPSISPSSGPDNATQAVTVTSSALPYGFTGVPFSITVGGLSLTSLTATASTTATGTIPSGGADGTADVVVHVDGVSATASGIYTFEAAAPSITGWQAGTPDFGSSAGQTPVTAPVLVGSNFSTATSVKLNGVEHIAHVTLASTTITFNAILAGTAGAFTTVTVVSPSGTATYGDGATHGWTYLPAGYHIYRADVGVAFSSAPSIATWADQGDLTENDAVGAGGSSNPTLATGSAINGLDAVLFTCRKQSILQSIRSVCFDRGANIRRPVD